MSQGIAEWFGLNRSNFILDPRSDAEFYAPRTGVDIPKLLEGLQVNLVTERPPKRFFWGVYGGGKSHTLFHISLLLDKLLGIHPISFLHLYHDGILASMGQDLVVELFKELIANIGTVRFEELLSRLKEILADEELSRAVASLLGARAEKELSFWRYISGVSVPQRDLAELNQTQALSDAIPSRLANIVIIIGRVIKKVRKKTLVLAIDEVDRLKSVTDEYGISTYEEAFRRLVDENQRDLAFLMGCSAANLRDLPDLIGLEAGPVLSRIGTHNLIQISEISADDVDHFIKAVLGYIVDKQKVQQVITELKGSTDETLEASLFPFTKEAIEALKGTLRGIMTPREITQRMSDSAGRGFLMKKRVITRDIIGG